MTALRAEDVFKLSPNIRWVGLASDKGEVVFVEQRPGLKSFSPEDTDRAFVQMGPLIISGVCERLSPWTGRVWSIVIDYDKVTSLITKVKDGFLCMTVEKEQSRQTVQDIMQSIGKWME